MPLRSPKTVVDALFALGFTAREIWEIFQSTKLEWASSRTNGKLSIRNPSEPREFIVEFTSSKDGKGLWKYGTACTKAVLDQVEATAQRIRGSFDEFDVIRRVIFSRKKLKGSWKFRDQIQISPCLDRLIVGRGFDWASMASQDDRESQFDHEGPPYPFLLEVKTHKLSNSWIETQFGLQSVEVAIQLLSLFVVGVLGDQVTSSERVWATMAREGFKLEHHLVRPGIGLLDMPQTDCFSICVGEKVKKYSGNDYYGGFDSIFAEEVQLPAKIDQYFEKFYSLAEPKKKIFARAAYYFSLAQNFRSNKDLALMNLSIAVECISNFDAKYSKSELSSESRAGPTKNFEEFIEKYSPAAEGLKKFQKQIYEFRSNIAHGVKSYHFDEYGLFGSEEPLVQVLPDWIVRKALIGWLMDQ